jgi:CRP/FNR family cyclic AMP-dependent transcriptional regulator
MKHRADRHSLAECPAARHGGSVKKVLYILGEFEDDDVEWLTTAGVRRPLARGDVLIREGTPIEFLFFVTHGTFAVTRGAARTEVASVGAGEVLGEISFVDRRAPTATVTATAEAGVLAVPREALNAKLHDDPGFAGRFYRAVAVFLADRLRSTLLLVGREVADVDDGELDLQALDTVSKAGVRFERILQRLQSV